MLPHNTAIVDVVPSLFDHKPVLVLASGFKGGNNKKLGSEVIQLFYLREDVHPYEAVVSGDDYSICKDCPLKFTNNKVCYVGMYYVGNMYQAFKEGKYPKLTSEHLQWMKDYRKVLRLGGYGDPICVPIEIVQPFIDVAAVTLGYTHGWRSPLAIPYRAYLQASVESPEEAADAAKMGWKYYRIKLKDDPLLPGEVLCPWHKKGKQYKQCQQCRMCDGRKANVAAIVSKDKTRRFIEYKEGGKNEF